MIVCKKSQMEHEKYYFGKSKRKLNILHIWLTHMNVVADFRHQKYCLDVILTNYLMTNIFEVDVYKIQLHQQSKPHLLHSQHAWNIYVMTNCVLLRSSNDKFERFLLHLQFFEFWRVERKIIFSIIKRNLILIHTKASYHHHFEWDYMEMAEKCWLLKLVCCCMCDERWWKLSSWWN